MLQRGLTFGALLSTTVVMCACGSAQVPAMTGAAAASSLSEASGSAEAGAARSTASTKRTTASGGSLCVSGVSYAPTLDDEFSSDSSLNATSNYIETLAANSGTMWATRIEGFANGGTRNNVGTDDAYYTDASRGFGGYNPFSFQNGALTITAEPVPSAYANASALDGANWLSGAIETTPLTFGYIEVSAKEPNIQGFWPAPLWLVGAHGADGAGNGYEELDVNELFGNALAKSTVQQTQIFSLSGNPPANFVRHVISPDPSTTYHTYGVLWTSSEIRFYVDRQPTSAALTNKAWGPASAIISLQVFTNHTWAPAPVDKTPKSMSLQYFRWYQYQGQSCGASDINA